jgi:predicted CopG family antitoxin
MKKKLIELDLDTYSKLIAIRGKVLSKSKGDNLTYSNVIERLIEHYNKTVL